MVYVIKAGGEKQEFEKSKIYETCKRSGVSEKDSVRIADEVEKAVYDGISTKEILRLVLRKLDKIEKKHALKYELREAVSKLKEPEEFEKYVQHLLNARGYETQWNVIMKGEIVEHQIDIIAQKDWKKYYIECKHHVNPHRFTGLQEAMQVWAAFDDLNKGHANFDSAWLVTNTKLSDHAIRYAKGKNIILTSWNYPEGNDLRSWIHEKGLYPVTILDVPLKIRNELKNAGILLLKELAEMDAKGEKIKLPPKVLSQLALRAKEILKT